MVAVVELSAGPGTTAAYARAALGLIPGFTRSGGTLPDVEVRRRGVTVDRSHLAAYDRICGFRLTDTLPPTYPHVLAFPLAMRLMTAPDFPLPLIGLVHIANRITVHRPIPSGASLDLSVRATALGDHPRGRRFDILATAALDGTEVWRGLSTYLRLGPPPPAPAPDPAQAPETTSEDSPDESRPVPSDAPGSSTAGSSTAESSTASSSAGGSSAGSEWRVPARVGTDYAAVSGDRNPIHTSRLGARLFGFPRPIAHGMWTKARALAALEGRLPDAYTADVAFRKPLLLPARATFTTVSTPDGWSFALASRHPHLTGLVTGPT
ncbi:MaoC/PaaZ C-terminal domain-containing protein [Actinoplanes xinjiangensis]|uniref:MaoC/PaaZ C-terminal domain-containing protein n=1 Tax=Actinoplanes xinjiangensis TaxID=512350 RepID=UPI003449BC49